VSKRSQPKALCTKRDSPLAIFTRLAGVATGDGSNLFRTTEIQTEQRYRRFQSA